MEVVLGFRRRCWACMSPLLPEPTPTFRNEAIDLTEPCWSIMSLQLAVRPLLPLAAYIPSMLVRCMPVSRADLLEVFGLSQCHLTGEVSKV